MNKKIYIGLFIAILVVGIILTPLGQYYDSPEAAVLADWKDKNPQIIKTDWYSDGHPIVFFTNNKFAMSVSNFKEINSGKKIGWEVKVTGSFTLANIIDYNKVASNPIDAGTRRKLDNDTYIYWGVALDEGIYNYQVNGQDVTTQEVKLGDRDSILWYIFGDDSLLDPIITEKDAPNI